MTVRDRVKRTQRLLVIAVIASAVAWGVGVALATLALLAFAGSFARTPTFIASYALSIAITAGAAAMLFVFWRGRNVSSTIRVALWIEEKLPRLEYAVVTAIEPGLSVDADALESVAARENISGLTSTALRHAMLPAAAALIVGGALLYVLPSSAYARAALFGRAAAHEGNPGVAAASRLVGLRVEISPPAYSGQARRTLDDPQSVRALVGSRVSVLGPGSSGGVGARIGGSQAKVTGSESGWQSDVIMPAKAAALTLTDRAYERVIVLDPQIDEPPKVRLVTPVRDTTLRTPQLIVNLHAEITDDVALGNSYYEYLITSGSGEIFSARTINAPLTDLRGERSATLDATLDLKSLKLKEGDVVSIRAIARDANTLTGPSIGTSDTRTIRIARAGEYDSVAVEAAAPPPVDSSAMSQRMLILMTEALVKKEKTLSRSEWVKQSTNIGSMEDRIRRRVYDVLYETESQAAPSDVEEEESDLHAIANKDFKQAYDALWDAVRSLQIAEPKLALPPMRIALAALDRARLAQRLYLRGMPPKIIVDLQRVRLTGKDKGAATVRTPRSFADSARVGLSVRFNAALDLIEKQPARAMTELALMRVDALSSFPDFAAALADATDAIRSGRDATMPLIRARRALDGSPQATPGLSPWSGG